MCLKDIVENERRRKKLETDAVAVDLTLDPSTGLENQESLDVWILIVQAWIPFYPENSRCFIRRACGFDEQLREITMHMGQYGRECRRYQDNMGSLQAWF